LRLAGRLRSDPAEQTIELAGPVEGQGEEKGPEGSGKGRRMGKERGEGKEVEV